jgi:hypothetical protein
MEVGMQGSKKVMVQLGQLDSSFIVLRQLVSEKLPFKASYWLRRNMDAVGKVYKPFIEAKQELFKEFAEKDEKGQLKTSEDGNNVLLIEEKRAEFWKEYNELAIKEVELEVYPLKLEWFEKVEISVEGLAAIYFMLEEEEKVEA